MEPSILINGSFLGVQAVEQTGCYETLAMTLIPSLLSGWQLSINIPKMLRKYWQ